MGEQLKPNGENRLSQIKLKSAKSKCFLKMHRKMPRPVICPQLLLFLLSFLLSTKMKADALSLETPKLRLDGALSA